MACLLATYLYPLFILPIEYTTTGLAYTGFPHYLLALLALKTIAAQNPLYLVNSLKLRRQNQRDELQINKTSCVWPQISSHWGLEILLLLLKSITHEFVSSVFIRQRQIAGIQATTILSSSKIWGRQMERQGRTQKPHSHGTSSPHFLLTNQHLPIQTRS